VNEILFIDDPLADIPKVCDRLEGRR